ncbi:MAG: phytanoyl-CoA dioxygenase family protein [Burkholderiaceae bacterium]
MTASKPDAEFGSLETAYDRDGFFLPYDVISENEARAIREDLEAAEQELADRPEELALLRSFPDRLLPSFDALIRHPRLLDAAAQLLGPDLMVWSSGLFIKEAATPSFVTWHQDLTYWGLNNAEEVTAWVALSPSTLESGCMRFIPGSHKQQLVAHQDSFDKDNLLSRGQEIAVRVDDATAVDVILKPGQTSLHHGHLFHASGPNQSNDRRIGAAIRYIKPSMRQTNGERTRVALVSGQDQFNHFEVAAPTKGRLLPEDFDHCRRDSAVRRQVLYQGAAQSNGQRY